MSEPSNTQSQISFLVMTCCVTPQLKVKVASSEERLQQYVDSILWWLKNTNVIILILENSGSIQKIRENFLNKTDAISRLEFIDCTEKQPSAERGSGWLEARMVETGLSKSVYLPDIKKYGFYKVTGRLIIKNFFKIDSRNSREFTLLNWWLVGILGNAGRVDLRFCYFTYSDYDETYRSFNTLIDDRKGLWLERVYALAAATISSKVKTMSDYPRVMGIMAHTGASYDGNYFYKWALKSLIYRVTRINRIFDHK